MLLEIGRLQLLLEDYSIVGWCLEKKIVYKNSCCMTLTKISSYLNNVNVDN